MDLIEDSGDEYEDERLTINSKFASKYEHEQRRKELQNNRHLLSDDDDDDDESDEEEEDEDGELLSNNLNLKIVDTINLIRKKDPKIYNKDVSFFDKQDSDEDDDDPDDTNISVKKRFKDVVREQLLMKGANIEGDDDDDDELTSSRKAKSEPRKRKTDLVYDEEQQQLRQQFLESIDNMIENKDDENIFKVREKTKAEEDEEERALKRALDEMKNLASDEKDTDNDAFLAEYILKKKWMDKDLHKKGVVDDESFEDIDADEEELDRVDIFESKYNFRFEELQSQYAEESGGIYSRLQVVGYSRNVDDSLRRVDDKRKMQRESRAEKKDRERRQKEAEIKRLKNLKQQELKDRLKKIGEIGGLKSIGILNEADLDEEWDPAKHEELMRKQFDEDYYAEHDDDPRDVLGLEDGDYQDGIGYKNDDILLRDIGDDEEDDATGDEAQGDGHNEDDHPEDITEYAPASSGAKALSARGAAIMDELYQLDYEDIVAGIPCRFKYRKVEPEDFGLTAEEILVADDSELNKFVSLRKIAPYAPMKKKEEGGEGVTGEGGKLFRKRKKLRALVRERLEREANEAMATGLQLKGSRSAGVKTKEMKPPQEVAIHENEGKNDTHEINPISTGESQTVDGSAPADSATAASKKKRKRRKSRGGQLAVSSHSSDWVSNKRDAGSHNPDIPDALWVGETAIHPNVRKKSVSADNKDGSRDRERINNRRKTKGKKKDSETTDSRILRLSLYS